MSNQNDKLRYHYFIHYEVYDSEMELVGKVSVVVDYDHQIDAGTYHDLLNDLYNSQDFKEIDQSIFNQLEIVPVSINLIATYV